MIRAVRRKGFVIWCMFFVGVWYVLGMTDVLAFNLFSAWTYKQGSIKIGEQYVQDDSVDDTIVGTVIANIMFGQGEYAGVGDEVLLQDALRLFDTSYSLIQVDILELLNKSTDPADVLQAHIKHIERTRYSIRTVTEELQSLAQEHLQQSASCLTDKKAGDILFFQGVSQNNAAETAQGLTAALDAAPCYITNRIKTNAYMYMSEKVHTFDALLARRYALLTQNTDLLINHTAYLEGDILEELLLLKQEIEQVHVASYQEVAGLLNYNVFNPNWDSYALPQFDKVFFRPDRMPRFD